MYEEVQKAVIEISEWFIRDNSVVYDLGSSTGETISLLLQSIQEKECEIHRSRRKFTNDRDCKKKCSSELVQFLQQHIEEINEFANIDLVLSLYTLQFYLYGKEKSLTTDI